MILINVTDAIFDNSMIVIPVEKKANELFNKWLIGHVRKISLLILNFFFNYDWLFSIIGWFNKRWNFLETVFVAYPANEKYALAYVYKSHRHWMRWLPWPAGIFCQNGKWGLMTVISALEDDFTNPDNIKNLKILLERTEKIRQLLGAKQKTFAGILPGVMYANRLIQKSVEVEVTVQSILQVERELKSKINYPDDVPLIILGGKGFIGQSLLKKLNEREAYCVDVNRDENKANIDEWPVHLKGKKAILINLTRKTVLSNYLHLFWPELVILNEVYPEPKSDELQELTARDSVVYHIVGLKAKSYPQLPKAYQGGIPCCAGYNTEKMEVIVRRLN